MVFEKIFEWKEWNCNNSGWWEGQDLECEVEVQ